MAEGDLAGEAEAEAGTAVLRGYSADQHEGWRRGGGGNGPHQFGLVLRPIAGVLLGGGLAGECCRRGPLICSDNEEL